MATDKTNKSFKDRLKVTKHGKVLHRHVGHNHYNAKESGEKQLHRNHWEELDITKKKLSRYLPFK